MRSSGKSKFPHNTLLRTTISGASMLASELVGHQLDKVLFGRSMQVAARFNSVACRTRAFPHAYRAVWSEITRALMQLRGNEAEHGSKRPVIVARNEARPAAIGDYVPKSCFFHGFGWSRVSRRDII